MTLFGIITFRNDIDVLKADDSIVRRLFGRIIVSNDSHFWKDSCWIVCTVEIIVYVFLLFLDGYLTNKV